MALSSGSTAATNHFEIGDLMWRRALEHQCFDMPPKNRFQRC